MSTSSVKLLTCSGCRQPICDRYFLSVAGPTISSWHCDSCLRCHYCQQVLDSHRSCFVRHGLVFCRSDYGRFFSASSNCFERSSPGRLNPDSSPSAHSTHNVAADSCVNTQQSTGHDEVQLNGQKMKVSSTAHDCGSHVGDRFTKYHCDEQVTASGTIGDRKRVTDCSRRRRRHDDVIRCRIGRDRFRSKCDGLTKSSKYARRKSKSTADVSDSSSCEVVGKATENDINVYIFREDDATVKNFLLRKKIVVSSKRGFVQTAVATDDVGVSRGGPEVAVASASEGVSRSLSTPSKFRRLRTSFKQQQLRLMKTYFSLNHNPDSKAIKSLANKTGLDERVLQNARAKLRRRDNRGGRQAVGFSDNSRLSERPPDGGQSTAEDATDLDATTLPAVSSPSTETRKETSSSQSLSLVHDSCSADSMTNTDGKDASQQNVMIQMLTADVHG